MDWISDLERAIPELAGQVSADAAAHAQVLPISKWIQEAIRSDDLDAAGRGFDWVDAQLHEPSDLQRHLGIYFVTALHFIGVDRQRRNEFFQRMPAKLFRMWRQVNQAIDAAHELE